MEAKLTTKLRWPGMCSGSKGSIQAALLSVRIDTPTAERVPIHGSSTVVVVWQSAAHTACCAAAQSPPLCKRLNVCAVSGCTVLHVSYTPCYLSPMQVMM